MDSEKMGRFIAERRKTMQMTQRELAGRLNITDKAVSKWERGLSCPDILLLASLAEALGVTTGELLNGEKETVVSEEKQEVVDKTLEYSKERQKDRMKGVRNIIAIACSALFALGILVCVICDLAISGSFTWSLFPVSSIMFAWLVIMPAIRFGDRGIVGSMVALSVLLIPFLWILNGLTGNLPVFMPIAVSSSILSLIYLWCVFAAFKKWRGKKMLAAAVAFLLSIPLNILINICVSRALGEALIDGWDIFNAAILGLIALTLFRVHFRKEQEARPSDRVD